MSGRYSRVCKSFIGRRKGKEEKEEKVIKLRIETYCPFCSRVPTTESQREARLKASKSVVEMDPEKRAEMRALARQRRKEMERERKKAIRAAYRRVREAKRKKDPDKKPPPAENQPKKEDEEDMEFDIDGEKRPSKPPPPFTDMTHNKQIMTNYKKHLLETEDKERLNMVTLYNDIENYLNLGNSKSDTKKKDSQAHFIYKTYYDGTGKKHMVFSDKIKGKISDRPKTAVLKDMQNYIVPKIEESFKVYLTEKAAENGMDPREFAGLSQAELSLRMGTDAGLMGTWKKGRKGKELEVEEEEVLDEIPRGHKRPDVLREMVFPPCVTVNICEHVVDPKKDRKVRFAKGEKQVVTESEATSESQDDSSNKGQGDQPTPRTLYQRRVRKYKTGRAQPTKEDKTEFLEALRKSAAGHLTLPMLYFYKYLLKHGEEDGSPLIDKDLFFYIEVQKFKDANHAYSDDELLRKKVQAIMECFLESVTSPPLQIDVSAQLHEKTLRGAQRYLAGKDIIPSVFDEAQLGVFKELLPYWAGFKRTFQQPDDPNKRPVTKYQKMLRKRLEVIENYEVPESEFNFPAIPEGSIAAYTFSLSDGVRWRPHYTESDDGLDQGSSLSHMPVSTAVGSKLELDQTSIRSLESPLSQQSIHSIPS